ncbi:MAG TPA: hypothetical protein VE954_08065 [Oligoflexus sp.]|uniref:hypothetical protein n=1 Tax=Oligoflexus sp. TaxID=1971216 RepID=UPI002D282C96|nr:hypothetical protein [Oligoflexus sp.]HYX33057.1 hypothetical protein [Oligoflexus sp.]
MSRYDRRDIMMELIELSRDIKTEIMQQLNYYRASVYKSETALLVENRIQELQLVADLIGDDELQDVFRDYEALKRNGLLLATPGECLLSLRTMNLLQATDRIFADLISRHAASSPQDTLQFSRHIQKHRRQLLSLCRQGSRQWTFFSTL